MMNEFLFNIKKIKVAPQDNILFKVDETCNKVTEKKKAIFHTFEMKAVNVFLESKARYCDCNQFSIIAIQRTKQR